MNEWISVKDRLPDNDEPILLYDEAVDNTLPTVGWYEADAGHGFFTADHCLRMRLMATHWCPIPPLPRERLLDPDNEETSIQ